MKRIILLMLMLSCCMLSGTVFAEDITIRLANGEWPPSLSENLGVSK